MLAGLQSLVIIGGVLAAVYRFRKEKPLKSRLQPTISGIAATKDGIIHLQVGVSAENVGQVGVALDKNSTSLRVASRKTGEDGWTRRELEAVLGQQETIQPGETLIDQEWFEFPNTGEVAFKLELSLVESEEDVSVAVEVVNLLAEGHNILTERQES